LEIIVKVDPRRAEEPAVHVRRLLGTSGETKGRIEVEEVFPGLRKGRSAGLVSLTLPDRVADSVRDALVKTLRADQAVEFVELPKVRRAK
jgi:hypothetical protein